MVKPVETSFLPVEAGNHLVLTDSKRYEAKGRDNDDKFYNELAPDGVIVAKYHVWDHMNIYPPQKTDQGWKKTDLSGNVIAEGKL